MIEVRVCSDCGGTFAYRGGRAVLECPGCGGMGRSATAEERAALIRKLWPEGVEAVLINNERPTHCDELFDLCHQALAALKGGNADEKC